MSLINKMLQDLDARRRQGPAGSEGGWQGVSTPDRRASRAMIGMVAASAVLLLAAAGVLAWRYWKPAGPVPAPAPSVTVLNASKSAPVRTATAQVLVPPPSERASPAGADQPVVRAEAIQPVPVPVSVPAAKEAAPAARHTSVRARPASLPQPAAADTAPQAPVAATPAVQQGRVMTARQQAESGYRRATAELQEGRISEAIVQLEGALEADPSHDAARQTLVGLLVEARRGNEAMRVLRGGLALDPRQGAMAMLLARLEIEHGGSGIDTLMRTLPYAQGDAEYRAFLAGALQRAQRHVEAIEQYRAALRLMPGSGVWWMGLGISLQAEKRNAEAADAYSHALSSASLSPELRQFTERRLGQVR